MEIDQLHKELEAASAMADSADVDAQAELTKAFVEQNEKESRIAELEEKLKRAAALEEKLRQSLIARGIGIADTLDRDDDDLPPASMPATIRPSTPPELSAENDEPSDEDE